MNTDRQSLERVCGDIAHIDLEIRHVQQVSESLARPLASEHQQCRGNRRGAQQDGGSLRRRAPERVVQYRAACQQVPRGTRGRIGEVRGTLQPKRQLPHREVGILLFALDERRTHLRTINSIWTDVTINIRRAAGP